MSLLLAASPEAEEARKKVWLELRRHKVTSTDVPVLFGEGYYGSSPTKLMAVKLGRVPDLYEPNEKMQYGRLMEPVTIAMYEAQTGRKVVRADSYTLQVSEKYPWLAASLDAFDSEGVMCELKNHDGYMSSADDIPTGWQIQIQTQLIVMNHKKARLVVTCRGCELKVFDIEPHPGAQAAIIKESQAFYELMQKGECPEPRFPADNDGLKAFFCTSKPGEVISLGDDFHEKVLQRAALLQDKTQIVDSLDLVEADLKFAMGEAEVALFPDDSRLTWKPNVKGVRSLRYYKAK